MDSESLRKFLRTFQSLNYIELFNSSEDEDCQVLSLRQCCLRIKLNCLFMSGDTSVINLPSFYNSIDEDLDQINLILNSA